VSSSSHKTTGDVHRRRKNRNGRKDMRGEWNGKGICGKRRREKRMGWK
jgi:hypothetical protein